MRIFLLSFLFSLSTWAVPVSVPAVTTEQFAVGNTWSWSYYEKGDLKKWYSTERYQVVDLKGTYLTFELWTIYNGATEYTPSAKFTLNLNRCFQAFKSTNQKPFKLKIYPYENGAWSKTGYDVASTAFEEKFNCNSKYYENADGVYQTKFKVLETPQGIFAGFQQLPKDAISQIRSFYFYDHPKLRGVAFEKTFNPQNQDFFEMRLTSWKMQ